MGKCNEKTLQSNKSYFKELNYKGITDKDYRHSQRVWDKFNILLNYNIKS